MTPRPALRHQPLALGLGAAALVLVLAARLPDGAAPGVFIAALALGVAFVRLDFGFAGGFRALLERGDGREVGANFVVPAVAALVILPVGSLVEGYGRFVAPIGPPLVLGAALFGFGMQIANGCASGVLVAAGQGSRRMWVALPFFCAGGVLGSLVLPMGLALPSLGEADLVVWFGPWGALAAMQALLLTGAALVLRGRWPEVARLRAGALIGALAVALFLASGMPWGITTGLTLWGGKAAQALGVDFAGHAYWDMGWTSAALEGSLLANHSSLADLGLLLGALIAAAAAGQLRFAMPLDWRGAAGAALGGVLMGIGARLSFGCNVGAFTGGAASGSLHGLVWIAAVVPGCWLGIRARPWFGLKRA